MSSKAQSQKVPRPEVLGTFLKPPLKCVMSSGDTFESCCGFSLFLLFLRGEKLKVAETSSLREKQTCGLSDPTLGKVSSKRPAGPELPNSRTPELPLSEPPHRPGPAKSFSLRLFTFSASVWLQPDGRGLGSGLWLRRGSASTSQPRRASQHRVSPAGRTASGHR